MRKFMSEGTLCRESLLQDKDYNIIYYNIHDWSVPCNIIRGVGELYNCNCQPIQLP